MDPTLEARFIALESRLAHHERMADELSDVLVYQTQQIDLLTQQVRRLRQRLAELEAGRTQQDDKPPPHY